MTGRGWWPEMQAGALHPLALWDAPFLPSPKGQESGRPLGKALSLPLLARRQLGAQLLATVGFCLAQGFYPPRRLWHTARWSKTSEGVALQLTRWPSPHLADGTLSHRLASGGKAEVLPWLSLRPVLNRLLPEYRQFWAEEPKEEDPWNWPRIALRWLLGKDKGKQMLIHPQGWGRFLWARHFAVPAEGGVFSCVPSQLRERLAHAGALVGDFTESELGTHLGESLAKPEEGRLVLTGAPLPGLEHLPLSSPSAFWCFLPPGGEEAVAPILAGACQAEPQVVGSLLAQAVRSAWDPGRARVAGPEGLLSPPAARLLTVLRQAGLGLTAEEAARLVSDGQRALEELARFSLVYRRFGRFYAYDPQDGDPRLWRELARSLGEGPPAWVWREALGEQSTPLANWCESQLAVGAAEVVLALAPLASQLDDHAPAIVEAALTLGWLGVARGLAEKLSGPRGQLLKAWWAAETDSTRELRCALGQLYPQDEEALPHRLRLRALLLRAQLAEREGNLEEAARWAKQLVALPEVTPALAVEGWYLADGQHLRWYANSRDLPQEVRCRALHLLGIKALTLGDPHKAEQLFARALRHATGANPLRFGELLADAGSTAVLLNRPMAAERFFAAAETWLHLAGCPRALRVVRFNRAVLANDRLQWQKAQELLVSLRGQGPFGQEDVFFLVEWARSWLACGDLEKAREACEPLLKVWASQGLPTNLRQGIATVLAHAALLDSDGSRAQVKLEPWLSECEPSEKQLLEAVLAGAMGVTPSRDLPSRWGLAFSARLLAQAAQEPHQLLEAILPALANANAEAAVGVARALLLGGVELFSKVRGAFPELRKALRAHKLEGWLRLVERCYGRDWVSVMGGLQALLKAGPVFWQEASWQPLIGALHLSGLRVLSRGKELLAVGDGKAQWRGQLAGFDVEISGVGDQETLAVLELALAQGSVPVAGENAEAAIPEITGNSPAVCALRAAMGRVAPLPVTVLILGEPGTGKERVAKAIHKLSGRLGEFVAVNCAGLPEALLEAELFGVVRGAFTGADRDRPGLVEQAEGGTLFLDEVGELPLGVQAKLLRLLQEKEVRRVGGTRLRKVDVRFLAATNRNLREAVREGSFRRDLFDRLAPVTLEVPPLRERPEDIPEIVQEVLAKFSGQLGLRVGSIAPEVLEKFAHHPWPGNVRELESVLLQALLRCQPEGRLETRHLPWEEQKPVATLAPFQEAKRAFFRAYFSELLAACGHNHSQAAKRAGLSRQALYYHLRELGLAQPLGPGGRQ